MTDAELSDVLSGAFAASEKSGNPARITLERGLKGKAQTKDGVRGLLLWREGGSLPSAATCARLALAAPILRPVYRQSDASGHDGLMMTEGADLGAQCQHVWGDTVKALNKKTETEVRACGRCEVVTSVTTRPIAGKPSTKYAYDSLPVSVKTLRALSLCGPVPQSMQAAERAAFLAAGPQQPQQRPAPDSVPPWQDLPPSAPAQTFTGQVCATCRSGRLTEYNEIECSLGWAAHDPVFHVEYEQKERDGTPKYRFEEVNGRRVRVAVTRWVVSSQCGLGHGEALMPLLAPQTRCMCVGGSKWLPKRSAN